VGFIFVSMKSTTTLRPAMWISFAVMPTSVALGFSLLDCAPDGASVSSENATTTAARRPRSSDCA